MLLFLLLLGGRLIATLGMSVHVRGLLYLCFACALVVVIVVVFVGTMRRLNSWVRTLYVSSH